MEDKLEDQRHSFTRMMDLDLHKSKVHLASSSCTDLGRETSRFSLPDRNYGSAPFLFSGKVKLFLSSRKD